MSRSFGDGVIGNITRFGNLSATAKSSQKSRTVSLPQGGREPNNYKLLMRTVAPTLRITEALESATTSLTSAQLAAAVDVLEHTGKILRCGPRARVIVQHSVWI